MFNQEISLLMSEYLEIYTNSLGLFTPNVVFSFLSLIHSKTFKSKTFNQTLRFEFINMNFHQRQSGLGLYMSACTAGRLGFGLRALHYPITDRVASRLCHLNMELSASYFPEEATSNRGNAMQKETTKSRWYFSCPIPQHARDVMIQCFCIHDLT
mgnify:CR=1 FL=1